MKDILIDKKGDKLNEFTKLDIKKTGKFLPAHNTFNYFFNGYSLTSIGKTWNSLSAFMNSMNHMFFE
jgi:hypothetical protein